MSWRNAQTCYVPCSRCCLDLSALGNFSIFNYFLFYMFDWMPHGFTFTTHVLFGLQMCVSYLGGSTNKLLFAANFTGTALFALLCTEMQFKDKWIVCLSLGEQTFSTKSSQQLVQFIMIIIILYASFTLFLLLSLIFYINFIYLCRTNKLIWNSVSTLISILFIIAWKSHLQVIGVNGY